MYKNFDQAFIYLWIFSHENYIRHGIIYFQTWNFLIWSDSEELSSNHKIYSLSAWHFFIWAWLPCSLGIFWFRSTLFGTTNFVKWTMTQLRLTKPHWLSWKILSPPVFESFLEIWHWVWEIVKKSYLVH